MKKVIIFITSLFTSCYGMEPFENVTEEESPQKQSEETKNDSQDDIKFDTCPICSKEFDLGERFFGFPSCGHIFHLKCIFKACKDSSACPKCGKKINGEEKK